MDISIGIVTINCDTSTTRVAGGEVVRTERGGEGGWNLRKLTLNLDLFLIANTQVINMIESLMRYRRL